MKAVADYLREFGKEDNCKTILFADVPEKVQPEDPVMLYTEPQSSALLNVEDVSGLSYAFTVSAKALAAFAVAFVANSLGTAKAQLMSEDREEVDQLFDELIELKANGKNDEIGFVVTQYLIEAISWDRLLKRRENPLKNAHVVMGCTFVMWFIGSVPTDSVKKLIANMFE